MKTRIALAILLVCTLLLALPASPAYAERPDVLPTESLLSSVNEGEALPAPQATEMLPSAVDWSKYLPPVAGQRSRADCTAWAVAYYYKGFQENKERGWDPARPEHQFSPSFIYNQRTTSNCKYNAGMTVPNAMEIIRSRGAATLDAFPYTPTDICTGPTETHLAQAWQYRVDGYGYLFRGKGNANIDVLKRHLARGDGFVLTISVYPSFYFASRNNPLVSPPQSNEQVLGYHVVFVVGYDDSLQAFKIVNSWGPYWGAKGFAYLSYDYVARCGWEAWAMTDHTEELAAVDHHETKAMLMPQVVTLQAEDYSTESNPSNPDEPEMLSMGLNVGRSRAILKAEVPR
ncbi:MAG: C1 family peptidase [Chloroflexi bacterium]|nr:C1 family peptidase [Chloroflexota bacterium]